MEEEKKLTIKEILELEDINKWEHPGEIWNLEFGSYERICNKEPTYYLELLKQCKEQRENSNVEKLVEAILKKEKEIFIYLQNHEVDITKEFDGEYLELISGGLE
jgi:hypothetical protein